MKIHNQTFTPSEVTRLTIAYAGPNGTGLLDLTGPAAAAAVREIARHQRPASGKPNGPRPQAADTVLSILRATQEHDGLTLDCVVDRAVSRVSRSRVVAVVRQLTYDGQIERGPDLPQARGAPLHRYRISPPLPPDDTPKRDRPRPPDIVWCADVPDAASHDS